MNPFKNRIFRQWPTTLLVALVFFQTACGVNDPTEVNQILLIDSEVVWGPSDGRITITNDIRVTEAGSLRIRPGTEIEMKERAVVIPDPAGDLYRPPNIAVLGTIICEGTPDSPITFVITEPGHSGRSIYIDHMEERSGEIRIGWTSGINSLWVKGGSPEINNCSVTEVYLFTTAWAMVDSCQIGTLFAHDEAKGVISNNVFSEFVDVRRDSLIIEKNLFQSNESSFYGAITCRHNSRATITNNWIENCAIGIMIFGASPSAHENNLINNGTTLVVYPESGAVQADTLDFSNNWWNTTSETDVFSQIEYLVNGGDYSEKVINYLPLAEGQFGEKPRD